MLTKKDLNQIEEITQRVVQKSISEAFLDFYDHIFEPYVEKNESQHKEIVQKIINIEKDVNTLKKDHDDRIKNLEAIVRVKN